MRIIIALIALCLSMANAQAQTYPMPEVPDSIREPEARADYAVLRFWERYDFQDTTLIHRPEYTEQAASNFFSLLRYASAEGHTEAIKRWLDQASQNARVFRYFAETARDYLYHPDSPVYNEQAYLEVLTYVETSEATDEAMRSRASFELQVARANQEGKVAADFTYETIDGQTATLHTTAQDRPLLLLFYDPDCANCRDLLFRLRFSSALRQAVSQGRLAVLAVYAEDDEELWRSTCDDAPEGWTMAIDRSNLKTTLTYDLRVMPALYLLDQQKRVMLKDTNIHALTTRLLRI